MAGQRVIMERRRISYTPSVDIVWEAAVGEGRGDLDESGTFAPPSGGHLLPAENYHRRYLTPS